MRFLVKQSIRLHLHSIYIHHYNFAEGQTKDSPAIEHKCKSQFQLEVFIGLFSSPVAGIALCYFKCLSFMDVAARFRTTGHIKHPSAFPIRSAVMFNDPALDPLVATDQMRVLNTDTHTQIHVKTHKHLVTRASVSLCAHKHELYLTFRNHDYSVCRSVLPLRAHDLHLHLFSQNFSPETGTRPRLRNSKGLITMLHKHCSNLKHWKINEKNWIKGKKLFQLSCSVTAGLYFYQLFFVQFSPQSPIRSTLASNVKFMYFDSQSTVINTLELQNFPDALPDMLVLDLWNVVSWTWQQHTINTKRGLAFLVRNYLLSGFPKENLVKTKVILRKFKSRACLYGIALYVLCNSADLFILKQQHYKLKKVDDVKSIIGSLYVATE